MRIGWDGHVLRFAAPNSFFLEWIRSNFRAAIEAAARLVLNHLPELQFVLAEDVGEDGEPPGGARGTHEAGLQRVGSRDGESATRPAEGRPAGGGGLQSMVSLIGHCKRGQELAARPAGGLRPGAATVSSATVPAVPYAPRKFASLGSFVAGPCNKLAMYSAEMVVRDPGKITPLFVSRPHERRQDAFAGGHLVGGAQGRPGPDERLSFRRTVHQPVPRGPPRQRAAGLSPQVSRRSRAAPRRFAFPRRQAGDTGRDDAHRRYAAPRRAAVGRRRRPAPGRIRRFHAGAGHAALKRHGLPD